MIIFIVSKFLAAKFLYYIKTIVSAPVVNYQNFKILVLLAQHAAKRLLNVLSTIVCRN